MFLDIITERPHGDWTKMMHPRMLVTIPQAGAPKQAGDSFTPTNVQSLTMQQTSGLSVAGSVSDRS